MKPTHAILTVLAAFLLVPAFAFAGERQMEIKIVADGEVVEIDGDDFEAGETRQSFTESGKEVLITRTEDGFQLEIDGKEIDVDVPHGDHHAMFNMSGDEDKKVVIRKFHGVGDEHGYHFIHAGEGDHHWVESGDDVDVVIERFSAADRLAESGVLDDLDEAKRQEILDTLREMEPRRIHKRVEVRVEEDEEED